MKSEKSPGEASRKLVNNLSIADARHLLALEGGKLSLAQLAFQLAAVAAVAATTAWAISTGRATAWHLALPMVAQYVALILALPIVYLFARHPGLRKDVIGSLRLWAAYIVVTAIATIVRSRLNDLPWREQLASDADAVWRWIADAHMQWPILIAAVCELAAIPGRVRNLYKYGPPFSGVSLGCAMRFVVLMFGCVLLPWIVESSPNMAWVLWTMILIAELLALLMLYDIQSKLGEIDGG